MTGHGHPEKAPIGLGLWVELCPCTPEAKGMRWAASSLADCVLLAANMCI
jgi:hypothetical protein